MKVVESNDGVTYIDKRRSGNTTRIADNVIQQLFKGHKVMLLEYNERTHNQLSRLRTIVLLRLRTEHNIGMESIDLIESSGSLYINLKYRNG